MTSRRQPFRLAAIDLDGTLLNSRHQVSPGNAAAVIRVRDLGIPIVLASGRQYHTIANFGSALGLGPEAPIIAYNGALTRTLGGETLHHQPLPSDPARIVTHFCAAHCHHLNYYLNDELYIRAETHWSRLYEQRTGTVAHVVGDLTRFDGNEPTKLLLIDEPAVTDRLCAHFQKEFGDTVYITKTEDEYLEFMDAGVSKGAALAQAAARSGAQQEQCVAFGDSFNDIPMLQWAGWGVAMANAKPAVQAVADQVAPPVDADGVAVVLAELF